MGGRGERGMHAGAAFGGKVRGKGTNEGNVDV